MFATICFVIMMNVFEHTIYVGNVCDEINDS